MPETTTDLSRAIRQLDLLEDYCDMFDRLVDMSDIGTFGDELAGPAAPVCRMLRSARRGRISIPAPPASPTSTRPSSAGFAPAAARSWPSTPTPPAPSATAWPIPSAAGIRMTSFRGGRHRSSEAQASGQRKPSRWRVGLLASGPAPRRLPRGAGRVLPRQPLAAAAEGDRPPAGPRRRAIPALLPGC